MIEHKTKTIYTPPDLVTIEAQAGESLLQTSFGVGGWDNDDDDLGGDAS